MTLAISGRGGRPPPDHHRRLPVDTQRIVASEATLWTHWTHCGDAHSVNYECILLLSLSDFEPIVKSYTTLDRCARYTKASTDMSNIPNMSKCKHAKQYNHENNITCLIITSKYVERLKTLNNCTNVKHCEHNDNC